MKTHPSAPRFRCVFVFLLLSCAPLVPLFAEANPYDMLGKVLMPLVALFSERNADGDRALQLSGELEPGVLLPGLPRSGKFELAIEYPDKLRLRAPVAGQDITIGRRGQQLWVYPATSVRPLIEHAKENGLPSARKQVSLPPFQLPIPEKQLFLLPALFKAKDGGEETVAGVQCRVLDARLAPELAKSLKFDEWALRIALRQDDAPARITLKREKWSASVRLDSFAYSKSLPPGTWAPSPFELPDSAVIPPTVYDQLLRAITGAK